MQIVRDLAGYTWGRSDLVRRAMSKKKTKVMEEERQNFVYGNKAEGVPGCVANGIDEKVANKIYDEMIDFAKYAFNKSHAACYAVVAYQTAYLKYYYPVEFMAALMTADMRWTDRLAIEMTECKRMGLRVLGPDINESYSDFATVGTTGTVRFGIAAIKGMGKALAEEVIAERDANGKFKSVCDFAKRVSGSKFNKKSWESAIKTGCFDSFGDRSDLLYNLEKIQAYGNKMQKDASNGQTDLFGAMGAAVEIPEVEITPAPTKYSDKEQLMWERDLMGLYISAHPLDKYEAYFQEQTMPISEIKPNIDGATVIVGGIITNVRSLVTKSGSKMAFVKIEDKISEIEVIVFPKTFEQVGAKLVQDAVVKVTGRVNATDRDGNKIDEAKINAEQIDVITDEELQSYESTGVQLKVPTKGVSQKPRNRVSASNVSGGKPNGGGKSSAPATHFSTTASGDAQPIKPKKVFVRVMDPSNTSALISLKKACANFPGLSEIILVIGEEKKAMRMPFKCDPEQKLVEELRNYFGPEGVVVK